MAFRASLIKKTGHLTEKNEIIISSRTTGHLTLTFKLPICFLSSMLSGKDQESLLFI